MTKVGEHITLDIIGTTKEYDASLYEKVINDIANAAKINISLSKPRILEPRVEIATIKIFIKFLGMDTNCQGNSKNKY